MQLTVYILGIVQIYAQDAATREGKNQDIVGYLSSNKVGAD
jgi:hypothetical protein